MRSAHGAGDMTINIENEYGDGEMPLPAQFLSRDEYEDIAVRVIMQALEQEGCPYEAEVNLTLTDDDGIRRINGEMRSLDKSTDVLSFPMVDFDAPGDFSMLEAMEAEEDFETFADDVFNPDSGELMIGDIVISVDHCLKQAEEYGHSLRREYAFLIAHSMLHLMGYDHMHEEEAAEMERRQEEILGTLGYYR